MDGRERVKKALTELQAQDAPKSQPPKQQAGAVDILQLLAALLPPPTPEEKRRIALYNIALHTLELVEDMKFRDAGYTLCGKCQWHHVPPVAPPLKGGWGGV